jgi:hypothetical protein
MSLLWVEGFEKYGSVNTTIGTIDTDWNVLAFKYLTDEAYALSIVDGRFGSKGLKMNTSSIYLQTPTLTANDTLICGLAFKVVAFSSGIRVMDFRALGNYGNTVSYRSLAISALASGEISVTRESTTLATSSGANLQDDTWYYLEVKVKAATSGGTVNVVLDGTPIINYTGNTDAAGLGAYSSILLRTATTDETHFDDWYICDGTGSVNNDIIGDCRVEAMTPSADASGNWTANTGSDLYAMVDEVKLNDDFISETASGNQAVFETNNISANAATGTIQGLMVTCDSQQYSANGLGRFKKYAKLITQNGSGGSVQDTGVLMPGQNYPLSYTQIMEDDPDGTAWIPSTANTFRVGVEVS